MVKKYRKKLIVHNRLKNDADSKPCEMGHIKYLF